MTARALVAGERATIDAGAALRRDRAFRPLAPGAAASPGSARIAGGLESCDPRDKLTTERHEAGGQREGYDG